MAVRFNNDIVLRRLVDWAGGVDDIRAMLLYSSRASAGVPVDLFSDYDVLLLLRDEATVRQYRAEDGWLEGFGDLMVIFRNPLESSYGNLNFGYVTHYTDGTKIDYTLYPVEFLDWLSLQPRMPDDFDLGYQVIMDKDGRAGSLPEPTGMAFITPPPDAITYRDTVDAFYNDACYVAKCLWREDLFLAKHCLDEVMKNELLRAMLEWQVKDRHKWAIRTGAHGKGLKKQVDPDTWAALEQTYVGAGFAENWRALYATIDLFREIALNVGARLGYAYPAETERRVMAHLRRVQALERP